MMQRFQGGVGKDVCDLTENHFVIVASYLLYSSASSSTTARFKREQIVSFALREDS
jgi:hypothetical protein